MAEKIFSFSATETGYNHIKAEPSKVCEDASGYFDNERMSICVVADGHGSDNYPRTDRGSKFAVDATIEQIRAFVDDIYNPDSENAENSENESNELIEKLLNTRISETHLLKGLSRNILMKWREMVENDVEKYPFQESEMVNVSEKYKMKYMPENIEDRRAEKAYGCTLIAYVVTEKFSFGLQIGDGKCVVIDQDGNFTEPIPWDDNCQMNVTTSICDSDASDEFRFFVTSKKPAAVFCGSDGIDDSYANVEEMYALYRSILKIFVEHGIEVGKAEIKEYLPVLTKKGSGDDVSIALIINLQKITKILPVFVAQTELFNLENQLKEKQHQSAVKKEKVKGLESKINEQYNQINELRLEVNQTDEEILTIQRKIENLKLRMQNVVEQCESEEEQEILMDCVEQACEDSHKATISENTQNIKEAVSCRPDQEVTTTQKVADGIIEKSDKVQVQEVCKEEADMSFDVQKIVVSEKILPMAEQLEKIAQVKQQLENESGANETQTPKEE